MNRRASVFVFWACVDKENERQEAMAINKMERCIIESGGRHPFYTLGPDFVNHKASLSREVGLKEVIRIAA